MPRFWRPSSCYGLPSLAVGPGPESEPGPGRLSEPEPECQPGLAVRRRGPGGRPPAAPRRRPGPPSPAVTAGGCTSRFSGRHALLERLRSGEAHAQQVLASSRRCAREFEADWMSRARTRVPEWEDEKKSLSEQLASIHDTLRALRKMQAEASLAPSVSKRGSMFLYAPLPD